MKKTVLITGASSGFGRLTAQKFQNEGWNVIATMRSPEKEIELNKLGHVLVCKLDVTDKESIQQAVHKGLKQFGTIDVLVNNAGYGAMGPVEAATNEQIRKQMDVNFFGLIEVTNTVLPQMRNQKSGIIINISSIGGLITFPYISLYHASKFAVEGLTEGMQYELNPLGICMKLIEPGAFKTDFATRSLEVIDAEKTVDYQENLQKFFNTMEHMVENSADPQAVADTIYEAATDNSEQLRYLVGEDALQLAGARKNMDDVSFKKMIMEQMGLS